MYHFETKINSHIRLSRNGGVQQGSRISTQSTLSGTNLADLWGQVDDKVKGG